MLGNKTSQLEDLKARIAALEARPAMAPSLSEMPVATAFSTFHLLRPAPPPLPAVRGRPQPGPSKSEPIRQDNFPRFLTAGPGLLHELFADGQPDTGAALGFALGAAQRLLTKARPALVLIQLVQDCQEVGLPYGAGLASFGIDPRTVVLTRTETITELLWALEEALACHAVAAVIADVASFHKELDFTVSRRLSLRAAAAGTSAFLVRYGREREASAAKLRWHIAPQLSGDNGVDPAAPGPSRWRVTLEKGRLGRSGEGKNFLLDWTENGFVLVEHGTTGELPDRHRPPLPGAAPAALGHRLSQAG